MCLKPILHFQLRTIREAERVLAGGLVFHAILQAQHLAEQDVEGIFLLRLKVRRGSDE